MYVSVTNTALTAGVVHTTWMFHFNPLTTYWSKTLINFKNCEANLFSTGEPCLIAVCSKKTKSVYHLEYVYNPVKISVLYVPKKAKKHLGWQIILERSWWTDHPEHILVDRSSWTYLGGQIFLDISWWTDLPGHNLVDISYRTYLGGQIFLDTSWRADPPGHLLVDISYWTYVGGLILLDIFWWKNVPSAITPWFCVGVQ